MSGPPRIVVVMGVSGSGKSLIGAILARELGGIFEDADDFHPAANKEKMSRGFPLTEEDRAPWYDVLQMRVREMSRSAKYYVLACSALRNSFRNQLRTQTRAGEVVFVYLKGSRSLIASRIRARQGHFMPDSLLDSQFAALEEPEDAIVVDVARKPGEIVVEIIQILSSCR